MIGFLTLGDPKGIAEAWLRRHTVATPEGHGDTGGTVYNLITALRANLNADPSALHEHLAVTGAALMVLASKLVESSGEPTDGDPR